MNGFLDESFTKNFPIKPVFDTNMVLAHMRSSLKRGLIEMEPRPANKRTLTIIAGGPSLRNTIADAHYPMAAVNGSLAYLLARDQVPDMCGLLDPRPHLADEVALSRQTTYFVASMCHPKVFDKLAGHHVRLWHAGGDPEVAKLAAEHLRPTVPGGSTMGLRWIDLGVALGYRDFDLHGFDSSFVARVNEQKTIATHAYDHFTDNPDASLVTYVEGYPTSLNFIHQVRDFFQRLPVWEQAGVKLRVHGEGLLQHFVREKRRDLLP